MQRAKCFLLKRAKKCSEEFLLFARLICASRIFNKTKHVLAKVLLPKAALLDWYVPGLAGEEKPRKNHTQEICPDRGSNPGPLRNRRACYRLTSQGIELGLEGRDSTFYAMVTDRNYIVRVKIMLFTYLTWIFIKQY